MTKHNTHPGWYYNNVQLRLPNLWCPRVHVVRKIRLGFAIHNSASYSLMEGIYIDIDTWASWATRATWAKREREKAEYTILLTPPLQTQGGSGGSDALSLSRCNR